MKVIVATHYFAPRTGGIETVARQHAEGLAERGHDVTVLSSRTNDAPSKERRDGYRIRRYPAYNPLDRYGIPYPVPNPIGFRRAFRRAIDPAPDVLHLHGFNYLSTALATSIATGDAPIVLHQHTPFIDFGNVLNGIERVNDRTLGRYNLRRADEILCVSENIRSYAQRLYPGSDPTVFPNGVDTTRFHPDHRDSSLVSDVPSFFSLVRRSNKKGVEILLAAAHRLEEGGIDHRILLGGTASQTDSVRKAVQDLETVELVGYVPGERLPAYYASADGFVFASTSGEAFPALTMLEALASGTPVIASDLTHSAETEPDGTIAVPPGQVDPLVSAIRRIAENPKLANDLGMRARAVAVESYDIDARVEELVRVYEHLT